MARGQRKVCVMCMNMKKTRNSRSDRMIAVAHKSQLIYRIRNRNGRIRKNICDSRTHKPHAAALPLQSQLIACEIAFKHVNHLIPIFPQYTTIAEHKTKPNKTYRICFHNGFSILSDDYCYICVCACVRVCVSVMIVLSIYCFGCC